MLATLTPIPTRLDNAEISDAPINWSHSAFDLHNLSWSDQAAAPTAHDYQSKYGAHQYFVDVPGRGLVALDRRSAVYAAAFLNGVDLVEYNDAASTLHTSAAAPLPVGFARAATLCSGRPAGAGNGQLSYLSVPGDVAEAVIVASGGRYPTSPKWLHQRGRRGQ
jgi:hypothetical protein